MLVIFNLDLLLTPQTHVPKQLSSTISPTPTSCLDANALSLWFLVASLFSQKFMLDNSDLLLTISCYPQHWSLPNLLISFVNLSLYLFNNYLYL